MVGRRSILKKKRKGQGKLENSNKIRKTDSICKQFCHNKTTCKDKARATIGAIID